MEVLNKALLFAGNEQEILTPKPLNMYFLFHLLIQT